MIASAQTLRSLRPVEPFEERGVAGGMSFGLSAAGYDVRFHKADCKEGSMGYTLAPGEFTLASTLERFKMPTNLLGIVHDKSTWARAGLAVQNTVIEPGWEGYLTLELTNHGPGMLYFLKGMPIAQIVFHLLDHPTESPYDGKYQHQEAGPQHARYE